MLDKGAKAIVQEPGAGDLFKYTVLVIPLVSMARHCRTAMISKKLFQLIPMQDTIESLCQTVHRCIGRASSYWLRLYTSR